MYSSFTSLVKSIYRYFILLDAILNRTIFAFSFWYFTINEYQSNRFHMLIMCPWILLDSYFISNSFLMENLEFSVYSSMPLTNSDNFTSSFWTSNSIYPARSFKTMLNVSGKSENPWVIPVPKGKALVFSLLSINIMLATGFQVSSSYWY